MFLKSKALFMVFLIVFVSFTIYDSRKVHAQGEVCCEKTKSGEYCRYTDSNDCQAGSNTAATTCDKTQFCKPSCAVDTGKGICYKSVPLAKIKNTVNMTAKADATCNSVDECNKGCCKIGSQYRLTTGKECELEKKAKELPDEPDVFDEGITTELACANELKGREKGCCITEQGTCSFKPRNDCSTAAITNPNGTIGFFQGVFCSDPNLKCGACKPKAKKGCVDGEDDVFYFDSCGNPEGIAEDCDYTQGTICKKKSDTDAYCGSINCEKTADFKDKNKHDPRIGGDRKHGESWCIYESATGGGLDRPGSRHFRHMCIDGEELVEPCRDFREEICLQSNNTAFGVAGCLENQIHDSPITQKVSTVPLGSKFWENEEADICAEGSTTCKVVYIKEDRFSSWKCKENCICETPKFLDEVALQCKSLGDCGVDINILSKAGSSGLSIQWTGKIYGPTPTKVNPTQWNKYGVFGGMKALSESFKTDVNEQNKEEALLGIFNPQMAKTAVALGAVTLGAFALGLGLVSLVLGVIALALLIYAAILGGAKIAVKTVNINCLVWQPPLGGADCDKCDDDKFKDCTEYRCRSLGTSCELINEGTKEEACAAFDVNDVNSPLISPWPEALPANYSLAVEQQGYSIKPLFEAFQKITFGVKTDEFAQCKIDDKHTKSYDEMASFMSDTFRKEHNLTLFLPDGKDYVYYIRCMDKRGNKNIAEYGIKFAIKKGPDLMPPVIEQTLIDNYGYVPFGVGNVNFSISLNEPAYCKWSKEDKEYELMEKDFVCDTEVLDESITYFNLYDCFTSLENIQDGQDNTFYFRCNDLSNNTNQESYKFTLKGSRPFVISSAQPTGLIYELSPKLKVTTSGGAEGGKSICKFSEAQLPYEQMIEMFETNSNVHGQQFSNLTPNKYGYFITCRDLAGNEASTYDEFFVEVDVSGPSIQNVYLDSLGLHLILNEASTCEYSNQQQITYGKGLKMTGVNTKAHIAPGVKNSVYYIACVDRSNNIMSPIKVFTKG